MSDIDGYVAPLSLEEALQNPATGDNPGYEYEKPAADAPLGDTITLYQLRNGKRDLSLRVGYADGAVRMAQ